MKKFTPVLFEIRPSKLCRGGVGLFAVVRIVKGTKIAPGPRRSALKHVIPWSEFKKYDKHLQKKVMDFCIGTLNGFIPPEKFNFNNLAVDYFLNHSCNGNVVFNKAGDFVAARSIRAGEELTYDYALAESNPKYRLTCTCANKKCRGTITGNDWKDANFKKRNKNKMSPIL